MKRANSATGARSVTRVFSILLRSAKPSAMPQTTCSASARPSSRAMMRWNWVKAACGQVSRPRARAAINQLAGEARKHLDTAFDLLPHLPPQVRPIFLPLALVRRDLARMAREDFDPFVLQPTSRLRTLWTLWRASRGREFGG